MWNPTACQIDMAMIAGSAVEGLPSQSDRPELLRG